MLKRPIVLGAIVAVVAIAAGIALVLAADSDRGRGHPEGSAVAADGDRDPGGSTTTTSTRASSTTTTTAPHTTTTSAAPTPQSTTPPATVVDPTDDPYVPVPVPAGVSAHLNTCSWQPVNGGELQASGTITQGPGDDGVWFVTAVWLEGRIEIDDQDDVLDLDPGQTKPWSLSTSLPTPPSNLSCALEIE
jgi:hypothetical protein